MDRFITMQIKSVEGEFIVMMAATVLMAVFSRHYNYGDVTASFLILFLPLFLLDLWMVFRIFRKICCRMIYGAEGLFYQSLPVPPAVQSGGRIFITGVSLLLMMLPVLWVAVKYLMTAFLNHGRFPLVFSQILLNCGYNPSDAPFFAALMLVSLIAFCFTLAALALLAAEAVEASKSGGKNRTFLVVLAGAADLVILIAVNLLPYLLVTGARIGEPALVPAGVLAVNILLDGLYGWLSVNLLEKHYKLDT